MSNSIIHETILRDIIDIIDDTKDFLDDQSKGIGGKDYHFTSLTRNAKNLTLVFPIICTKGISVETASMITKAVEKKCVVLLQILFASVQITNSTGLQDYISKFHSNISVGDKITVDDFIDFTNTLSEAAIDDKCKFIKITDKEAFNLFRENMRNFNTIVKNTIRESALSDFKCYKDNIDNYNAVLENDIDDQDIIEKEKIIMNTKPVRRQQKARYDSEMSRQRLDFVDKLSANDIKKANELMPTKVMVDFYSKDKDSGDAIKVERGLIGVKCKLYVVDSLEIIERIATKYADSNWVRQLVRATSGEISFWRDFVFALDKAKIDALNSARRGTTSKMFKVLERRALKNRLGKWKANKADSAPITTLVINQDEVEYLKKDYDINVENRNIAIKLMTEYNLMGVIIVNEPAEYASFIWDEGNDATYETLSFRNLERESDDKNYKKVINLMTKISR